MEQIPDLQSIQKAAKRIEPYINKTPVLCSELINMKINAELYFKCENFQKAGAFKFRGATNAIFSLNKKQIERGVCTHSSGNHAAALAKAALLRNTRAHIVMPENSSPVKIAAVKAYKGEITYCKPNLESRESTLKKVREKTGAVEIHPYNDNRIISGQATAAKELLEEVADLDFVIAPVGGGGLISGTALSTHFLCSGAKVIAAEPKGADDAYRSFYGGEFVPSINPNTIADGLLTSLGSLTYPLIKQFVDGVITVNEKTIIEAMKLVWERMKIIIEPSSAVPLGAILENPDEFKHKRIGIIVSGGNFDLDKIPWIL